MQKIKSGDTVIITAGKDKGKTGKVVSFTKSGERVIVEGANLIKKHVRPNPNIDEPGGIKSMEAPLHISNVAIYNSAANKADRVGFKKTDNGYVRIFKSNQEQIDA